MNRGGHLGARFHRAGAFLAGTALVVAAIWACGPPPVGYTGAGRMTELPAIMMDSGGASMPDAPQGETGDDEGDLEAGHFDASQLETGAPNLDGMGGSSSSSSTSSSSSSSSHDAGQDSGV